MRGLILSVIERRYSFLFSKNLRDDLNAVISEVLFLGQNMSRKEFLKFIDRELYRFSVAVGFKKVKVLSSGKYKSHWTKWGYDGIYVSHHNPKSMKRFYDFKNNIIKRREDEDQYYCR